MTGLTWLIMLYRLHQRYFFVLAMKQRTVITMILPSILRYPNGKNAVALPPTPWLL